MKSELERAATFIDSLSPERKTAFLVRVMYELTLAGRASYSVDSIGIDQPTLLRELNELQHTVSAQLMNIVSGDPHLRSWTSLASLFLESSFKDESLRILIRNSFVYALTASLHESARQDS